MYNKDNFFNNTRAVFKACKTPKREPDYTSHSGSKYWYGCDKKGEFIIRQADHWSGGFSKGFKDYMRRTNTTKISYWVNGCGKIKSCYWILYIPKNEEPFLFHDSVDTHRCWL